MTINVAPSEDRLMLCSGSFRTARLPGQATHAARAVGLWVEKNPAPPPNRQALEWSVVLTVRGLCPIVPQENPAPPPNCQALEWSFVLTVGRLCPIVPQDNIVVSSKHN